MRSIQEILTLVCNYLNEHEVEYVIVGGIAVIAYGNPRTTMDADIIVKMNVSDMRTFANFLKSNGFFSDPNNMEAAVREKSHFSAIDKDSLFRLDIKAVYGDMDRRTIQNRRAIDYKGLKMFLASPEDTIANKLVFGSEQDIRDADGIYIRQLPNLNMHYLEEICSIMNVQKDLHELRKRVEKFLIKMAPRNQAKE